MLLQEAGSRMAWPNSCQELSRLQHDTWLHALRQCGMQVPDPAFQCSQEQAQSPHVNDEEQALAPTEQQIQQGTATSAEPPADIVNASKPFGWPAGPHALPAVSGIVPVMQQQQQQLHNLLPPGAGIRGTHSCSLLTTCTPSALRKTSAAMIASWDLKAQQLLYV